MKLLFIVNPISGGENKDELDELINTIPGAGQHAIKIYSTTGENDLENIVALINDSDPDRVIASGGDGTIQLVAKSLLASKKQIPLAIIPKGSANGLATSLKIPNDIHAALQVAVTSKNIWPMDLLRVNDNNICIHLCDLGTNALLIKYYDDDGVRGMVGYAKHLLRSIQDSDILRCSITTDNGVYEKEGYMLAIANAHQYGTGVHITDGSVSDGEFEISNVQKIDLESAFKAGLTILNVFVDQNMFSDLIRCRKAVIKIQPKAHFQIDGEYMGLVDQVKVEMMASAIKIVLPDEE